MRKLLILAVALAGLTPSLAFATVTLKDRQQAACYNDVQKLCGQFIPDSDKVEACMSTKKDQVSPKCRAFFED